MIWCWYDDDDKYIQVYYYYIKVLLDILHKNFIIQNQRQESKNENYKDVDTDKMNVVCTLMLLK